MSVFVYFANLLWEQTKTGLGTPNSTSHVILTVSIAKEMAVTIVLLGFTFNKLQGQKLLV